MTQTALILGPTGRFGLTVMDAFQAAGWATRGFSRGDDLTGAARGVDIIVNGWNPAYPDWKDQVPQLTDQVIRAALRDRLPRFADIPFPGFTLTGAELAEHVGAALGRPQRVTGFSWWLIRALRPVWPLARGVTQMRYLWDKPHHLSQTEMTKILPNFVPTPVHQAIASALEVEVQPYQAVA